MHVTRGEAAVVLAMSGGRGPRSRGCADGWVGLLRNLLESLRIKSMRIRRDGGV